MEQGHKAKAQKQVEVWVDAIKTQTQTILTMMQHKPHQGWVEEKNDLVWDSETNRDWGVIDPIKKIKTPISVHQYAYLNTYKHEENNSNTDKQ